MKVFTVFAGLVTVALITTFDGVRAQSDVLETTNIAGNVGGDPSSMGMAASDDGMLTDAGNQNINPTPTAADGPSDPVGGSSTGPDPGAMTTDPVQGSASDAGVGAGSSSDAGAGAMGGGASSMGAGGPQPSATSLMESSATTTTTDSATTAADSATTTIGATTPKGTATVPIATNAPCAKEVKVSKSQGKAKGASQKSLKIKIKFNRSFPCSLATDDATDADQFATDIAKALYAQCDGGNICDGTTCDSLSPGSLDIGGTAYGDNILDNAQKFFTAIENKDAFKSVTVPGETDSLGDGASPIPQLVYVNEDGQEIVIDACDGCYNGGTCNGVCICTEDCSGEHCKSCKLSTGLVAAISVIGALCVLFLVASIFYLTKSSTAFVGGHGAFNNFNGYGPQQKAYPHPRSNPYSPYQQYGQYSTKFPPQHRPHAMAYRGGYR